MNKKGQTEDFTDWLLLVIGIIFLMLFLQFAVIKSIEDKNVQSVKLVESNENINNYLTEQRGELEKGNALDAIKINGRINQLRSPFGAVKK
ncbi:MAG: hypothetical protein V2A62_05595 [Candidatus Woesearchaeota archaeon]